MTTTPKLDLVCSIVRLVEELSRATAAAQGNIPPGLVGRLSIAVDRAVENIRDGLADFPPSPKENRPLDIQAVCSDQEAERVASALLNDAEQQVGVLRAVASYIQVARCTTIFLEEYRASGQPASLLEAMTVVANFMKLMCKGV